MTPRRKAKRQSRIPAGWTIETETRVNGRILTPGTEVSIKGERGRFRFVKRVRTDKGADWLDFIGGPVNAPSWRSFGEERVKRVHRIAKTRKSQQEKAAA